MMIQRGTLARAAFLVACAFALPLAQADCPAGSALPFTAGPLDAKGLFSTYVVDSNGVGLKICTDSVSGDGNPPPCFYDPVVPTSALSVALGRGNEAFYFLADNVFTTTGAFPIDAVLVYGVESAFLSAAPEVGFQTQFQRMRTRVNVSKAGRYTVESPWGKRTYDVTEAQILAAGNGQNRSEISEPIDITFGADTSVPGQVAPFLVATPEIAGYGQANGYIGDGLTPTLVSGSPCGQNFVRVTATELDGVTGIDINNGLNVYTSEFFTVMGKRDATSPVPLAITAAYYSRSGTGVDKLTVLAEGSASASTVANVTLNASNVAMARDGTHLHATLPFAGAVPATVSVTANDAGTPSRPNTQIAAVTDLVTISTAEARCSGTGPNRSCLLTVHAESSDKSVGAGAPTLTLVHSATPLVNGAATVVAPAVPASVAVKSSANGLAMRAVTLVNQ